jgi:hypothetical protein
MEFRAIPGPEHGECSNAASIFDARRRSPWALFATSRGPKAVGENGDPPAPRETASARDGGRLLEPRGTTVPECASPRPAWLFHLAFPGCQAVDPAC